MSIRHSNVKTLKNKSSLFLLIQLCLFMVNYHSVGDVAVEVCLGPGGGSAGGVS